MSSGRAGRILTTEHLSRPLRNHLKKQSPTKISCEFCPRPTSRELHTKPVQEVSSKGLWSQGAGSHRLSCNGKCVARWPRRLKKCSWNRIALAAAQDMAWQNGTRRFPTASGPNDSQANTWTVWTISFETKPGKITHLSSQRNCICENKQTKLEPLIKWWSSGLLTFHPRTLARGLSSKYTSQSHFFFAACVYGEGEEKKRGDRRWGTQQPPPAG